MIPTDCQPTSDEAITHEHVRRLWKYRKSEGHAFRIGQEPLESPEFWLVDRLRLLAPLCQKVTKIEQDFIHGVVYAVKFFKGDAPKMSFGPGGLAVATAISPERIVAKAIMTRAALPPENFVQFDDEAFDVFCGDGIVRAVARLKNKGLACPS